MQESAYRIVIVGSGPAGLAAAVRAARHGISHVVLERGALANTIHKYRRGKFVMAEPASLALHGDMGLEFTAASREQVLDAWSRDASKAGANILMGRGYEVIAIEGSLGAFRVLTAGGETFRAEHVVVAIGTGGAPRALGIPGENLPHVTSDLDDAQAHVDKHVVIVGAGDSAIEDALALAECDNEVAIVQRRPGFDRAKAGNRTAIESAVKRGEIAQYVGATVRKVEQGAALIDSPKGEQWVPCDLLIARLGSRPPRAFLEGLGIEFTSPDPEALPIVSETYESSVSGIYLVGELIGRPLIKHCMNQGYEVVEHILGRTVTSADEPLLRSIIAPTKLPPEVFGALVRKTIPLYRDLGRSQTRALLLDSRVHVLDPGEEIYAAGDYSESIYMVIDGIAEVFPAADADWDERDEEPNITCYGPGEFFGEDSLFSGRERLETAVAGTQCMLLECSRVAVTRLQSSLPALRETLDRTWARRKLAELFPMLTPEECSAWAEGAIVGTFQPGTLIFREGDLTDGLHLVRRGSVTVSRERDGHDQVVSYVAAGDYLGEVGCIDPNARRSASVRANVVTETLHIPSSAVRLAAARHPALRAMFERRWREQLVRDEHMLEAPTSTQLLDFVVSRGAKEGTDLLVIDESLCIRCDNCEKACEATHAGVSRLDREAGSRYAGIHLPTSCQHCENPLCMTDCPPGALRRHPDGEVLIDDTCIGCGNCASNCTYGVIKMTYLPAKRRPSVLRQILFGAKPREAKASAEGTHELAVKCDLCRDLPHSGSGSGVACVAACPTGAMARVSPSQLIQRVIASQSVRMSGDAMRPPSNGREAPERKEAPEPAAHHDLLRARLASLQIEGIQSREQLAAALRELAAELETSDGSRSA